MGFYHRIIVDSTQYTEIKEIIENPPKLVEKYNSFAIKSAEYLTYKGGHPIGWELVFDSNMFFTNQKEVKHINDNMYAYLFGYGDKMIDKVKEISNYLLQNTKDCNDEIKNRTRAIVNQMYDIIDEIKNLGRAYGLDEENAYVILDMSDGMEHSFNFKEDYSVELIKRDYTEYYSKMLTKEEVLAKLLNQEDFIRL